MPESVYMSLDGPKGKADVVQLSPADKPREVQWEVRYQGQRHSCSAEGEASIVAMELVGTPDPSLAR
ncbi:MAG: hypothetical protein EXR51_08245 [Dehalococcoidia bacterium]|nr:hypothetical protein [Dehalococcoidia bacterium]